VWTSRCPTVWLSAHQSGPQACQTQNMFHLIIVSAPSVTGQEGRVDWIFCLSPGQFPGLSAPRRRGGGGGGGVSHIIYARANKAENALEQPPARRESLLKFFRGFAHGQFPGSLCLQPVAFAIRAQAWSSRSVSWCTSEAICVRFAKNAEAPCDRVTVSVFSSFSGVAGRGS